MKRSEIAASNFAFESQIELNVSVGLGAQADEGQKRRGAERTEEPRASQQDGRGATAAATQRPGAPQTEAAAPEARPTASDKDPTGTKQIYMQSSFQ
eukprot:COSAG04_NODE_413_length_14740_cov_85.508572_11_plen_97_part_00